VVYWKGRGLQRPPHFPKRHQNEKIIPQFWGWVYFKAVLEHLWGEYFNRITQNLGNIIVLDMQKAYREIEVKDAKKLFRKLGTCSSTMYYILNREFGQSRETEVRAAEPLAGGIMQNGYQCGMLWGSVMAAGAEVHRRFDDRGQAAAAAIITAQKLMASFKNQTGYTDCIDVTKTDWHNKFSIAKFMLTGKFLSCFRLIEKWAPEAIVTAYEGLSSVRIILQQTPVSCASETARRMGSSEEEAATVTGFAGGMGLSGGGCGALATAIWLKTMKWQKEGVKKFFMTNPYIENVLKAFLAATDYEFTCRKITGREFKSIDEHTEFIRNGGCEKVIGVVVNS